MASSRNYESGKLYKLECLETGETYMSVTQQKGS